MQGNAQSIDWCKSLPNPTGRLPETCAQNVSVRHLRNFDLVAEALQGSHSLPALGSNKCAPLLMKESRGVRRAMRNSNDVRGGREAVAPMERRIHRSSSLVDSRSVAKTRWDPQCLGLLFTTRGRAALQDYLSSTSDRKEDIPLLSNTSEHSRYKHDRVRRHASQGGQTLAVDRVPRSMPASKHSHTFAPKMGGAASMPVSIKRRDVDYERFTYRGNIDLSMSLPHRGADPYRAALPMRDAKREKRSSSLTQPRCTSSSASLGYQRAKLRASPHCQTNHHSNESPARRTYPLYPLQETLLDGVVPIVVPINALPALSRSIGASTLPMQRQTERGARRLAISQREDSRESTSGARRCSAPAKERGHRYLESERHQSSHPERGLKTDESHKHSQRRTRPDGKYTHQTSSPPDRRSGVSRGNRKISDNSESSDREVCQPNKWRRSKQPSRSKGHQRREWPSDSSGDDSGSLSDVSDKEVPRVANISRRRIEKRTQRPNRHPDNRDVDGTSDSEAQFENKMCRESRHRHRKEVKRSCVSDSGVERLRSQVDKRDGTTQCSAISNERDTGASNQPQQAQPSHTGIPERTQQPNVPQTPPLPPLSQRRPRPASGSGDTSERSTHQNSSCWSAALITAYNPKRNPQLHHSSSLGDSEKVVANSLSQSDDLAAASTRSTVGVNEDLPHTVGDACPIDEGTSQTQSLTTITTQPQSEGEIVAQVTIGSSGRGGQDIWSTPKSKTATPTLFNFNIINTPVKSPRSVPVPLALSTPNVNRENSSKVMAVTVDRNRSPALSVITGGASRLLGSSSQPRMERSVGVHHLSLTGSEIEPAANYQHPVHHSTNAAPPNVNIGDTYGTPQPRPPLALYPISTSNRRKQECACCQNHCGIHQRETNLTHHRPPTPGQQCSARSHCTREEVTAPCCTSLSCCSVHEAVHTGPPCSHGHQQRLTRGHFGCNQVLNPPTSLGVASGHSCCFSKAGRTTGLSLAFDKVEVDYPGLTLNQDLLDGNAGGYVEGLSPHPTSFCSNSSTSLSASSIEVALPSVTTRCPTRQTEVNEPSYAYAPKPKIVKKERWATVKDSRKVQRHTRDSSKKRGVGTFSDSPSSLSSASSFVHFSTLDAEGEKASASPTKVIGASRHVSTRWPVTRPEAKGMKKGSLSISSFGDSSSPLSRADRQADTGPTIELSVELPSDASFSLSSSRTLGRGNWSSAAEKQSTGTPATLGKLHNHCAVLEDRNMELLKANQRLRYNLEMLQGVDHVRGRKAVNHDPDLPLPEKPSEIGRRRSVQLFESTSPGLHAASLFLKPQRGSGDAGAPNVHSEIPKLDDCFESSVPEKVGGSLLSFTSNGWKQQLRVEGGPQLDDLASPPLTDDVSIRLNRSMIDHRKDSFAQFAANSLRLSASHIKGVDQSHERFPMSGLSISEAHLGEHGETASQSLPSAPNEAQKPRSTRTESSQPQPSDEQNGMLEAAVIRLGIPKARKASTDDDTPFGSPVVVPPPPGKHVPLDNSVGPSNPQRGGVPHAHMFGSDSNFVSPMTASPSLLMPSSPACSDQMRLSDSSANTVSCSAWQRSASSISFSPLSVPVSKQSTPSRSLTGGRRGENDSFDSPNRSRFCNLSELKSFQTLKDGDGIQPTQPPFPQHFQHLHKDSGSLLPAETNSM
eukprot:GHVN01073851.1.p1 GENE.GHVN01073851.1~~GHVN01073851.1.p1  ORF type:complete len:1656 (-),score=228.84 GHVN01073851.1:1691-6658(-)